MLLTQRVLSGAVLFGVACAAWAFLPKEPHAVPKPLTKPPERRPAERVAWEEAKGSATAAAYAGYLTRYPQGRYAALAQAALQKLQREASEEEKKGAAQRRQEEERQRLMATQVRPSNQVAATPPTDPAGVPNPVFRMKLETDRGSKPSYKIGDFLNLTLSMNTHGTAYCYYQDVSSTTARIFPNKFHSDSMVPAGAGVKIPSGGFRIRFDMPGSERVACIGSDRELVVPSGLQGVRDLSPLPVRSVDDVIGQYKQSNPFAVTSMVDITVTQ